MAGRIQRNWLLWLTAALIVAFIVFAWIDGGREPLREISEPVPVPENQQ